MSSILDPYIPLFYYLGVWGLVVIAGYIVNAEKHGILLKPYLFLLKTVAFNSWMERIGGRFRRFWLTYFDIGAAMGLGLLVTALFLFASNAVQLAYRTRQAGPTFLIVPVPGVTIRWDIFPYILIAIAVLLIPHEAAHGIASVLDRVPIKSSGVFMAIFLPGGFVEIDEEDLAKRKAITKLRVFSAGSFTNVATWGFVLLLFTGLFQPTASGVLVTGLVDGGAAQAAGIQQWSVITQLNSTRISNIQDLVNYLTVLNQSQRASLLNVHLKDGQIIPVTTRTDATNSSHALIGINSADYVPLRAPLLSTEGTFYLTNVFRWNLLILLNVGIVNMLPLYPFDGDRYFDTLLSRGGIKKTKYARIIAGLVSVSLLGLNLFLSFTVFGTVFLR